MAAHRPKPNKRVGIPEVHMPDVLRLSAEGKSRRDIAAWLLEHHGVKVDHTTVARRIRETRDERRESTQAAIAGITAKSATTDLEVLGELQADLRAKWKELKDKDLKTGLLVADRLHAVSTTKLKAAGVGDEPTGPSQDFRAELTARMRRLAGDND